MRRAYADFVLGAYHAEGLYAADFRFLDFEGLALWRIESRAHGGHHHGLSGGYIGGAAHNLSGVAVAFEVNCRDMQVVAVGMHVAREHLAHDDTGQTSADAFDPFDRPCLKADRRKELGQCVGREVEVHVFFKPFI